LVEILAGGANEIARSWRRKGKHFPLPPSLEENGNEKLPLGRSEASLMLTLNQFGQKM